MAEAARAGGGTAAVANTPGRPVELDPSHPAAFAVSVSDVMATGTVHFRLLTRTAGGTWRQAVMEPVRASSDKDALSADCPVCPHPSDAHDQIGARYCAATVAGKFERGCVCVTGEPAR